MRDDCASLQLSLPEEMDSRLPPELRSRFFTVVWRFRISIRRSEVQAVTLLRSTGGRCTLNGLTSGALLSRCMRFAVRSGACLFGTATARWRRVVASRGQRLPCRPERLGNLVVEAPGHVRLARPRGAIVLALACLAGPAQSCASAQTKRSACLPYRRDAGECGDRCASAGRNRCGCWGWRIRPSHRCSSDRE